MWGVIEHLYKPAFILELLTSHMHESSWLLIHTPTEDALVRKVIHLLNKILRKQWMASAMYNPYLGSHTQCLSRRSIRALLERLGFQVERVEDTTYGFKYMVKKPGLEENSAKARLKKVLAFIGYILSFLGHRNHMIVYARLKKI